MEKCVVCGTGSTVAKSMDQTFNYKGKTLVIHDYKVFECLNCGEAFVDESYENTIERQLRDFHREVEGLLKSHEIKAIRESLGFKQDAFGELLGGGKKAFARYENCTVTQSKPMDNLLRILRDNPESLDSIIPECDKLESPYIPFHFNYNPKLPQAKYNIKVAS